MLRNGVDRLFLSIFAVFKCQTRVEFEDTQKFAPTLSAKIGIIKRFKDFEE